MGRFSNQAIFGALNQLATGKESALEALRLAIARGGDVNSHDWDHGLTPLARWTQLIAQTDSPAGMLPIIILLEAGADPNKKDKGGGRSALDLARELDRAGLIETLESH